jgi:putative heme utilization carrier protein HutX
MKKKSRVLGMVTNGICAAAFAGAVLPASAAEPACATAAQVSAVRAAFAKPTPPAPFAAAAQLKMPEALVVSALPAEQAYGVAATHFQTVWKSLETWDQAVFVVMKGGHVFEVYGKVFAGEPSKRSNFFNLHGEGAGMSGHLRPDLLSSIYVIALPGKDSVMRGVMFYDAAGEAAFGVYLSGEGPPPPASLVKKFEATAEEIRALPSVCAKPGA